jgi:hypothetical protein
MNYLQINLFILAAGIIVLFVGIILNRASGESLKNAILYGLGWSCFIGMFDAVELFMVL